MQSILYLQQNTAKDIAQEKPAENHIDEVSLLSFCDLICVHFKLNTIYDFF